MGELNGKQREIKTLKRELESKEDDLGETTRLRNAVARENKRVQEDIVTMTAENQVITLTYIGCMKPPNIIAFYHFVFKCYTRPGSEIRNLNLISHFSLYAERSEA